MSSRNELANFWRERCLATPSAAASGGKSTYCEAK